MQAICLSKKDAKWHRMIINYGHNKYKMTFVPDVFWWKSSLFTHPQVFLYFLRPWKSRRQWRRREACGIVVKHSRKRVLMLAGLVSNPGSVCIAWSNAEVQHHTWWDAHGFQALDIISTFLCMFSAATEYYVACVKPCACGLWHVCMSVLWSNALFIHANMNVLAFA